MGSAGEVPVCLPNESSSKLEVEYGLESVCMQGSMAGRGAVSPVAQHCRLLSGGSPFTNLHILGLFSCPSASLIAGDLQV